MVVILIAAGAGSDLSGGGDEGASAPTAVTEPTTETTTPPQLPSVEIPDVVGMSTADARNALQEASLTDSVEKKYSNEAKGTVLKQTPRSRLEVPEGTTVELIVAQPFPKVPNVTSKNLTQARRTLRNAGFTVAIRKKNSTTQRDGDIVSQNPSGGTQARPGRTVTLVVIHTSARPDTRRASSTTAGLTTTATGARAMVGTTRSRGLRTTSRAVTPTTSTARAMVPAASSDLPRYGGRNDEVPRLGGSEPGTLADGR